MADFVKKENSKNAIIKVSDNDRTITYRLSDDSIDREHSRIVSSGIETAEYSQNPIFLWAHNSSGGILGGVPEMENVIGRTVGWRVTSLSGATRGVDTDLAKRFGVKLAATEAFDITVEHAPASINPQGERALRMVRGGFLNMTSIGAQVVKVGKQKSGIRGVPDITLFSKTNLLEGSLVPIPANSNAVALARAVVKEYDLLDTFADEDAEDVEKWVSECRDAPKDLVDLALGKQIAKAITDNLIEGSRSKFGGLKLNDVAAEAMKAAGFKY